MIVDLLPTETARIEAVSNMLVAGFAVVSPRYLPTREKAREAVVESFGEEKISRILLTPQGEVAGWIAGAHAYAQRSRSYCDTSLLR